MNTTEELKPITGASEYGVSPDGKVVNLETGATQAEHIYNRRIYVSVCDDNGKRRLIDPHNPNLEPATLPSDPMREVDGFPDYMVTEYGAVWKVRNTGRRYRNQPFLCSYTTKKDIEYYQLRDEDGRVRWVRLSTIMDVWPEIDICQ